MPACDTERVKIATFVVGALSLLLLCATALALDPSRDASQYAQTAGQVRDGFTPGSITSIAQVPDGHIWLGTGFWMFRFDGLRAEPWQPPVNGEQHPSNPIPNGLRLSLKQWNHLQMGKTAQFETLDIPQYLHAHGWRKKYRD